MGTFDEAAEDLKENLAGGWEKTKNFAEDAADTVKEKVGDAAEFAKDKAEDVTEFAKDKAGEAKEFIDGKLGRDDTPDSSAPTA
jgi:hypothetical protein